MESKSISEMQADHEAFCGQQLKLPENKRWRNADGISYMKCRECGKPFSYVNDECSDGFCSNSCGIASHF